MKIFYGTAEIGEGEIESLIKKGEDILSVYGDIKNKVVVCRSSEQKGNILQWKLSQRMGFVPMFTAPDFHPETSYAHRCYDIDIILDWKNNGWETHQLERSPQAVHLELPQYGIIQMTSATTGEAKMVLRTVDDIKAETKRYQEHMNFRSGDRFMTMAPFYHSYAFFCVLLMCELNDADLVIPDIIIPRRLIELCGLMKVNCLYAIPYILDKMTEVNNFDSFGNEMKVIMSTAQAVSPELDNKFMNKFGYHISSQYGSTEVGCTAMNSAEDGGWLTPLSGIRFKTFKNNAGQDQLIIDTGKTGGYYILPDKIECIHEKGFRTSDVAELRENGSVRILGRADRVLIRTGEKLDAGFVEKILEGFEDIQKTVINLNDRNELICNYSTFSRKTADVSLWKNYCSEKLLSYQIPEYFVYDTSLEASGTSWKETGRKVKK